MRMRRRGFPDKMQIEELASRHYTDLTFFNLDINPKKYFSTWITDYGIHNADQWFLWAVLVITAF